MIVLAFCFSISGTYWRRGRMGRMDALDVYSYVVMMSIYLFNVYVLGALITGHVQYQTQ